MNAETRQKRASLYTLGCRLNQSETKILEDNLHAAGYAIAPFGEPADLGIINTCTVTREADAKSRKMVRAFVRKNPDAYTAVIGCYAQMGHKALAEIPGVDLIVGNQEKLNVLDYVSEGKNERPVVLRDRITRDDFTIAHDGHTDLTERANLKIQDGCDFMCSFCIIPFARGRARSRDFDNLFAEAKALVQAGARELVLTGVNAGTYSSKSKTIVDVVDRLSEIPGLDRVRISSIEPTTIPIELFHRMGSNDHALVPHLHIPLQSASDRILQAMKRKYSRREFVDFIEAAYDAVPDLCIGTDVMVGFPGETETDFEESYSVIQDSPIAYAHVFKYSERAGAASAKMGGKVDPQEASRRSARIRRLSELKRARFNAGFIGRTLPVLFEQSDQGYWTGYTENYVRAAVESAENLENQIRAVRIERQNGDLVLGSLPQAS